MTRQFCDGLTRRDMLTAGSAGLFGTTFSLSSILEGQARAARPGSENSLIILFLSGGLSTIDTWDLKPEAPKELRGPFNPIATSVPGVQIGELFLIFTLRTLITLPIITAIAHFIYR